MDKVPRITQQMTYQANLDILYQPKQRKRMVMNQTTTSRTCRKNGNIIPTTTKTTKKHRWHKSTQKSGDMYKNHKCSKEKKKSV